MLGLVIFLVVVECLFAAMASYALEKHAIGPVDSGRGPSGSRVRGRERLSRTR